MPLVGAALLEAWNGQETEDVSLPEPPALNVPPPHEAFDDRGEPVLEIHRESGPGVRRALRRIAPPSRREPSSCDGDASGDTAPEVTTPDPVEGEERPTDDLSMTDWEEAYYIVVGHRQFREWANNALRQVAMAVAEMASGGSMRLLARPLLGGPAQELDTALWATGPELRMRRLAASGISLAAPFEPSAAIDHLLFVEADQLVTSVEAYGKANWVAYEPTAFSWPERKSAAERRNTVVIEAKIREELKQVLILPENKFWREPQAQNHIRRHRDPQLGLGNDENVSRICKELIRETRDGGRQYASLGLPGRPRFGMDLVRKR